MAQAFIGKKVRVEIVQEVGWKRPVKLEFGKKSFQVLEVLSHWEEHKIASYWRDRKHLVWYEVLLGDGNRYQLYWDRGAKGKGDVWILVERL